MTKLEQRNEQVLSIIANMTKCQVKRHGADIDEAARMSLVYFERHPNSRVSTRSIFFRRLRSLHFKRAKALTFDPRDKVDQFKCISTI